MLQGCFDREWESGDAKQMGLHESDGTLGRSDFYCMPNLDEVRKGEKNAEQGSPQTGKGRLPRRRGRLS